MSRHLRKIIKKCRVNDRKAQFELYNLSYEHLMKTCRRYKRNREDAVALLNDGFLKILQKLDTYDPAREYFPWASTIMVRTAIDDYRKNLKYDRETDLKETDGELEELMLQNDHARIVDHLSGEELREMIFRLPEKERLVFNLHEGEGYGHREIAEKLGVTERSCIRYLKAAKLKLRGMIEKKSDLKKVI